MFELSVALKYLIPRKKQLSVSLISALSVVVISLVVWLLIVFLSITEGIEKNWLHKLTALNAPLRITPTEHYYNSYYHLIDAHSSSSQFTLKTIGQKLTAHVSDPYSEEEDRELPLRFPGPEKNSQGELIDPVKQAFALLSALKKQQPDLTFQDFELSGALMRLQLLRQGMNQEHSQSYLTQASYLSSIPYASPALSHLILPSSEKDLNHLIYLASHTTEYSREDAPHLTLSAATDKMNKRLLALLSTSTIQEMQSTSYRFSLPEGFLPENISFPCIARSNGTTFIDVVLPTDRSAPCNGSLKRTSQGLHFEDANGRAIPLSSRVPVYVSGPIRFQVEDMVIPERLQALKDIQLTGKMTVQNHELKGTLPWFQLEVVKAKFHSDSRSITLPEEKETGVFLAKHFKDNGVLLGDRGYLSYNCATASSVQEQRLPIFVAGFYDPGILSVGNRCILVPDFVTQTINASSSSFNLDKTQSNGLLVWFSDVHEAEHIKTILQDQFKQAGIDSYWKITTFREYDFAKDLLQQFQSDKYLFALVGVIILIVACCNIISLLTLLVNDKKKEIGILQAMGASNYSVARIFGFCGVCMGLLSCLIGTSAAMITLYYIDSIVHLLSILQGHDAFNTAFFGGSLPNHLSSHALKFIFIVTPLLSLCAGLIPALKACRLRPSEILRSE